MTQETSSVSVGVAAETTTEAPAEAVVEAASAESEPKTKAKAKPKTKAKAKPKAKPKAKKAEAAEVPAKTKFPTLPKGLQPGVQELPLSVLAVREGANPRLEFGNAAHEALMEDLRNRGQMQAIAVAPREDDDKLEIIYGERRFRAAQALGWKTIKADVVVNKSREEHFAMRVAENIHRADLNAFELARAFQGYIEAKKCSAKDAAEFFNVKPAFLSQRIKILKMPPELQLAISKDEINFTQARELARLDPKEQVKTLGRMLKSTGTRAADITREVETKRAKKRTSAVEDDGEGKRRGRPPRTKDNAPDILRQPLDTAVEALNNYAVEYKPKAQLREGLVTLYEKFTNSRSESKKELLKGAIRALEWALGIRDDV